MKCIKSSFERIRESDEFQFELAKVTFAMEIKRCMDAVGINNTQLAEKLGVSKPMITKLLRGDANVTIETMVKASLALNGKLALKIEQDDNAVESMVSATKATIAAFSNSSVRNRPTMPDANLDSWPTPSRKWQESNETQPIAA